MTSNICIHCGRGLETAEQMHSQMCEFCLRGETPEVKKGHTIYVDPIKLAKKERKKNKNAKANS